MDFKSACLSEGLNAKHVVFPKRNYEILKVVNSCPKQNTQVVNNTPNIFMIRNIHENRTWEKSTISDRPNSLTIRRIQKL